MGTVGLAVELDAPAAVDAGALALTDESLVVEVGAAVVEEAPPAVLEVGATVVEEAPPAVAEAGVVVDEDGSTAVVDDGPLVVVDKGAALAAVAEPRPAAAPPPAVGACMGGCFQKSALKTSVLFILQYMT